MFRMPPTGKGSQRPHRSGAHPAGLGHPGYGYGTCWSGPTGTWPGVGRAVPPVSRRRPVCCATLSPSAGEAISTAEFIAQVHTHPVPVVLIGAQRVHVLAPRHVHEELVRLMVYAVRPDGRPLRPVLPDDNVSDGNTPKRLR